MNDGAWEGEGVEDLLEFDPETYVDGIFQERVPA